MQILNRHQRYLTVCDRDRITDEAKAFAQYLLNYNRTPTRNFQEELVSFLYKPNLNQFDRICRGSLLV